MGAAPSPRDHPRGRGLEARPQAIERGRWHREAAAPIAMMCASPCHGGNEEVPGMEVGMQREGEDRGRGRPTHNGCRMLP